MFATANVMPATVKGKLGGGGILRATVHRVNDTL
jgi:hypothetical protein